MANVRDHICFPTIIHEFNLDIPIHDKIQMVSYIKNSEIKPNGTRQTEDDINKISYFKHLKDTVINDESVFVDPEKRDCDIVFQDFSLFPNFSLCFIFFFTLTKKL